MGNMHDGSQLHNQTYCLNNRTNPQWTNYYTIGSDAFTPLYNTIRQNLPVATKVHPNNLIHHCVRFSVAHRLFRSAEQRFSFTFNTMEKKTFAGYGLTHTNPSAAWQLNCDDPDFSIWSQSEWTCVKFPFTVNQCGNMCCLPCCWSIWESVASFSSVYDWESGLHYVMALNGFEMTHTMFHWHVGVEVGWHAVWQWLL